MAAASDVTTGEAVPMNSVRVLSPELAVQTLPEAAPWHTASAVAVQQPGTNPPMEFAELHQISPLAAPDDAPGLVSRGDSSGTSAEPTATDLLPAFRAYNRGDFGVAAVAFAALADRFPDAEIPALYLGVSQLESGEDAAARGTLTRALRNADGARHADATWYLAVAELRTGDAAAAVPLLQSLCPPASTPYAPRACALAKQSSGNR